MKISQFLLIFAFSLTSTAALAADPHPGQMRKESVEATPEKKAGAPGPGQPVGNSAAGTNGGNGGLLWGNGGNGGVGGTDAKAGPAGNGGKGGTGASSNKK